MPRVMTSNRARHELIQLPTNSVKVRLLGTRRQSGTVPGTVPDLSGPGRGRPAGPIRRPPGLHTAPARNSGPALVPGRPQRAWPAATQLQLRTARLGPPSAADSDYWN